MTDQMLNLTDIEIAQIEGGTSIWDVFTITQVLSYAATAIGGLLGAASVWVDNNSVGTATPTGNDMYPYTDPCL